MPNPNVPPPRARRRSTALAVIALALVAGPSLAFAPREAFFELSAKELDAAGGRVDLPAQWLHHPGDDPKFASWRLDDSAWQSVDLQRGLPAGWDGIGWFRLRFRADPALTGIPLGLTVLQYGAAEVFLDGELLLALGTVGPGPDATRPSFQRQPYLLTLDGRGEHLLAIRFANHAAAAFERSGRTGAFRISIGDGNERVTAWSDDLRASAAYRAFFTGIFAAFAVLHFLLWAFYREAEEHLYFALLSASVAALVDLFFHSLFTTDPSFFLVYDRAMNVAWLVLSVCAVRFVHGLYEHPPRQFYGVLAAALALALPAWLWPQATRRWVLLLLLLASVEMVRTVVVANLRRKAGARIVGAGILVLAAGITIGLLAHLGAVPSSIVTAFLIPFFAVLFLIFAMSVYLSRRFARANRDLREQLLQVRELSARQLEQERRAREDEVERRLLAAENERQARELEEARRLQLSMLPERLPELVGLEVAADMFTATEVGGDYYDFKVDADGLLTVAIGDATGHGMRAGTLVTATKSLFNAIGDGPSDLSATLGRFARALKRMNFRQLCMSLTLAQLQDGRLRLAAAGMPPALVHRAATGRVESIVTESLPLGSFATSSYSESRLDLLPGDTLLLMSDGFPERLNGDDEMLGYEQAADAFARAALRPAQGVIESLVADGENWARGAAAVDDMTFVVLKMTDAAGSRASSSESAEYSG